MKKVRVIGIQCFCDAPKKEMLERAKYYIEEAISSNPNVDVICFPEAFYQSSLTKFEGEEFGEEAGGAFEQTMKSYAKAYNVNIVAGSYAIKVGDKVKNTCLVIDRSGEVVGDYSKVHLFDSFGVKESDVFESGNQLGIFDLDFGKIGVIICYDLRFPEFIRKLAVSGIDMLFVPAAFFHPRLDQWQTLIKSAAIQGVMHVCAVNQIGATANSSASYFGRSMLVDPYGNIIAGASDKVGYFFGEVDFAYQDEVRRLNPCLEHRRPELYR